MIVKNPVPQSAYGIRKKDAPAGEIQEIAEQVRRLGYARLSSGLNAEQLVLLSDDFENVRSNYLEKWGVEELRRANEHNTVRALCTQGVSTFVHLALNARLFALVSELIEGTFILNQQNGVINPPRQDYNQGSWHRDLPYQHFQSSTPLAINALFCIDDFTLENGATFVLPASHKSGPFPSAAYIEDHAIQIEAKAGDFLVLDCMVYHSGGYNGSARERRAINHVFNIPYFKQQISLPPNMSDVDLSQREKELFGFTVQEAHSVGDYIGSRLPR